MKLFEKLWHTLLALCLIAAALALCWFLIAWYIYGESAGGALYTITHTIEGWWRTVCTWVESVLP